MQPVIPLHDVLLYGANTPVSPSLIQYGSSSIAILEADNGEGEDFFTRDGLKLLSNNNYLSDELEDTMDLLLGTTGDSAYQSRRGISERLTVLHNWSEVKKSLAPANRNEGNDW